MRTEKAVSSNTGASARSSNAAPVRPDPAQQLSGPRVFLGHGPVRLLRQERRLAGAPRGCGRNAHCRTSRAQIRTLSLNHPAPASADRCRYLEILRLDYTLPPPVIPRPADQGRRRKAHDRQMAESGGARRGRFAQVGGWHPARRGDLADALEHLPASCAGRVVRGRSEAVPPRTVPTGTIRR